MSSEARGETKARKVGPKGRLHEAVKLSGLNHGTRSVILAFVGSANVERGVSRTEQKKLYEGNTIAEGTWKKNVPKAIDSGFVIPVHVCKAGLQRAHIVKHPNDCPLEAVRRAYGRFATINMPAFRLYHAALAALEDEMTRARRGRVVNLEEHAKRIGELKRRVSRARRRPWVKVAKGNTDEKATALERAGRSIGEPRRCERLQVRSAVFSRSAKSILLKFHMETPEVPYGDFPYYILRQRLKSESSGGTDAGAQAREASPLANPVADPTPDTTTDKNSSDSDLSPAVGSPDPGNDQGEGAPVETLDEIQAAVGRSLDEFESVVERIKAIRPPVPEEDANEESLENVEEEQLVEDVVEAEEPEPVDPMAQTLNMVCKLALESCGQTLTTHQAGELLAKLEAIEGAPSPGALIGAQCMRWYRTRAHNLEHGLEPGDVDHQFVPHSFTRALLADAKPGAPWNRDEAELGLGGALKRIAMGMTVKPAKRQPTAATNFGAMYAARRAQAEAEAARRATEQATQPANDDAPAPVDEGAHERKEDEMAREAARLKDRTGGALEAEIAKYLGMEPWLLDGFRTEATKACEAGREEGLDVSALEQALAAAKK